jgi:hypothetical protein
MTELTRAIKRLARDIVVPESGEAATRGGKAIALILIGVGSFLALTWPNDIMSRPWAQNLVAFMTGIAPWLDRIPIEISHPIARFHVAALWAMTPITFLIMVFTMVRGYRLIRDPAPLPSAKGWLVLGVICAGGFLLGIVVLDPSLVSYVDRYGHAIYGTRGRLAGWASIFIVASQGTLSVALISLAMLGRAAFKRALLERGTGRVGND